MANADQDVVISVGLDFNQIQSDVTAIRASIATIAQTKAQVDVDTSRVKNAIQDFINEVQTGFGRQIGANLTNALVEGLRSGTEAVKGFGSEILHTGVEFEQLQVSFETFLGSGEKAKKLIDDLVQFSATTPFQLPDVEKAGKQLLAFGIESEKIVPTLRTLGDVASGSGAKLDEIGFVYGRIRANQKVFAGDLDILASKGVPIISALAKEFNVTEGEVRKLVEKGEVGFPAIEKAFQAMSGAGGQFYNLTIKQSETLGGKISNLIDTVTKFKLNLFEGFKPAFSGVVDVLGEIGTDLSDLSGTTMPQLKAEAKGFADELKKNPELAKDLARSLNDATVTLGGAILEDAKELATFLSENPKFISEMISGMNNFVKLIGDAVAGTLKLANYLAKAKEDFDVLNTHTAAGKLLTPEEVGIRNTVPKEQQPEFDKRAIDNQEGQGVFHDDKAVEKIAAELTDRFNETQKQVEKLSQSLGADAFKDFGTKLEVSRYA